MTDRMSDRLAVSGSVSTVEGRGCGDWAAKTGMMLCLAMLLVLAAVGLLR